jgi:hypothetical protein
VISRTFAELPNPAFDLHKASGPSAKSAQSGLHYKRGLDVHGQPSSCNEIIRKGLWSASNFLASKMRFDPSMKSYIHVAVRRLLELHALEERLATFKRSRENTGDVEALIDSLRGNMLISVLNDHDRLRARGKRSVAEVRHGVCSGCHIALAIGNAHEIKTGLLRHCDNCGRYLYVVEKDDEPTPAPTPAKPRRNTHDKSTATRSQVK